MTGRVAIVATGARSALGADLDTTWTALARGESAVGPIAGFDASALGDVYAAQIWQSVVVPEDDPALRILGRHGQLLGGVLESVHAAGRAEDVERSRLGLFTALGVVDSVVEDLSSAVVASRGEDGRLDYGTFFGGAYRQVYPLWPLAMLNNVAVGQISIDLDIQGDNLVLSSEADAGVRALIEGVEAVREGLADAALVGAASESISPGSVARLALRGVLGEGPVRPCAVDGAGTAPGEAAAAFLLRPEDAPGGLEPLAYLRGGATSWGLAADRPGPTGDAIGRAIDQALVMSGVEAADVGAVFLHAEGRAAQDEAELDAVLGRVGKDVPLVATKGALGHAGSAAPVLDLALAVEALQTGRLPPSQTSGTLLAAADGRLSNASVQAAPAFVLIVAAGAQGGAAALVLEAS